MTTKGKMLLAGCAGLLLTTSAAAQATTLPAAIAAKKVQTFGEPLRGHPGGCTGAAYSPDGQQLLTCGSDGELRIWAVANGKLLREIRAHQGYVHGAGWCDGGKAVYSFAADRSAAFFDAAKGSELGRVRDLPEKLAGRMSYFSWQLSADGTRLWIEDPTYKSTSLVCIDVAARALAEPLQLAGGTAKRFVFSPDNRFLATLESGPGFQPLLRLVDRQTGETVKVVDVPYANAMRFSPDGKRLFTCSAEKWQVWDGESLEPVAEFAALLETTRALAISRDGARLYAGSSIEGKLVALDLVAQKVMFEWSEFGADVFGVALSADEKTVAAGSLDGTVRFFDALDGKEQLTGKGCHTKVTALAVAPDGKTFVTGTYDNEMLLWDVKKKAAQRRHREHGFMVTAVGFVGAEAFSIGQGGDVKFMDLKSGKVTRSIELKRDDAEFIACAAGADGGRLVACHVGERDGAAVGHHEVWDLAAGKRLAQHTTEVPFAVFGLSADGATMAALSGDHVALWSTGQAQADAGFPPPPLGYTDLVLLGADAVSADLEGQLQLWRKGRQEPVATVTIPGEEALVRALSVSSDGKRLAAGSRDALVLFDGELAEVARLTGLTAPPSCLAFSRDGKALWCGMQDGTVLAWQLR